MNTFETLDELWLGAASQIRDHGSVLESRDGGSKEILGYVGRVADPRANFMFNPIRRMSASYAAAELLWYLSGTNSIDMIKQYAPQYERFSDDGKTAYGAYGYRWRHTEFQQNMHSIGFEKSMFFDVVGREGNRALTVTGISQLEALIWLLKTKPNTRQAILSMWTPGDLPHAIAGTKKDLPCTLNLIFMVRDGTLYLSANMRSNDIWLGLPYDAWCFMCIQQLVAEALGLKLGWYQHSAMSLHVYDRNMEKFLAAASPPSFSTGPLSYSPCNMRFSDSIAKALSLESHNRKIGAVCNEIDLLQRHSLMAQVVVMAASKWTDNAARHLTNPLMERHVTATD